MPKLNQQKRTGARIGATVTTAATAVEAQVQGSTTQALSAIRQQFEERWPDKQGPLGQWEMGPYVRDIFLDDGYLVCEKDGTCWRVGFTKGDDGEYAFVDTAEWVEVYLTYVDAGATGADESKRWVEAPKKNTRYFRETLSLREGTIDETTFVVKGVTLIRPGFSANTDKAGRPRYYAAETLKAAANLFEGTRAYRNHPRRSDEKDLPERDVRDIVGWYQNVTIGGDGEMRGDMHVVGESRTWLWPLILETPQKPDLVELSINALGVSRIGEAQGKAAVVVEAIVAVNSVDVVTTGAAGGTFAGALLAGRDGGADLTASLLAAMTFEEWRAARQDYVNKLKGEWRTVREGEALKAAQAKSAALTTKLAEAQAQNRAVETELAEFRRGETADRLLAESGLPHSLRKQVRPQLLAASDEPAMRETVGREVEKWKTAPKPPVPVQGGGQRPAAKPAEPVKTVDAGVALLGVSEAIAARPGESGEEYRQRRMREQEKA